VRPAALLLVLALGCARPRPPSPYLPPETQFSTASTLAATGGLVGLAAGAQMMDSRRSSSTRHAGAGVLAAGGALMLGALIDAVDVYGERKKFVSLWNAGLRNLQGSPGTGEPLFRPPPPPLPEVPFEIPKEDGDPDP
jgi:hypothetical protein